MLNWVDFMQIDGSTTIVGVTGHPVEHTMSPAMRRAVEEASRRE
jgi:shikimate 5-dehydrogenase